MDTEEQAYGLLPADTYQRDSAYALWLLDSLYQEHNPCPPQAPPGTESTHISDTASLIDDID